MKKRKTSALAVKYPYCAGIDIAKKEHWVAARDAASDEVETRQFGGYTEHLENLARWLHEFGVKQVAMEATGVYWIPAFELLARSGFEVWLVNPQQTTRGETDYHRLDEAVSLRWLRGLEAETAARNSARCSNPARSLTAIKTTASPNAESASRFPAAYPKHDGKRKQETELHARY